MKLSDREILYIVERGKIIPADREVSMNNEVLQGILTELQTLREIAKAANEFCKDCMGECSMCRLKEALAVLKKGEHGDSLSS